MQIAILARLLTIFFLFCLTVCEAQTLGGNAAYSFLKLPANASLASRGGTVAVSGRQGVDLSYYQPASLLPAMHSASSISIQDLPAGIRQYFLASAYGLNDGYMIAAGLQFLDYGMLERRDAAGNPEGRFRPLDYSVQVGVSAPYQEKWRAGMNVKFIRSQYDQFSSSALAADLGLIYQDSARRIRIGLLIKNAGMQLKEFEGAGEEDLPFDLQAGISAGLKNLPLTFSLNLHHLHRYSIYYEDPVFSQQAGIRNTESEMEKIFRHLVLSAEFTPVPQLELVAGYNHLLQRELRFQNSPVLAGFSFGLGLLLKKVEARYAISGRPGGHHSFSLNFWWKDLKSN